MRLWTGATILAAGFAAASAAAQAAEPEQRLKLLEAALEDLLKRDAEKDQLIRRMQRELAALRAGDRTAPADESDAHEPHAGHAHDGDHTSDRAYAHAGSPDLYAIELGGGVARLRSVGASVAFAAGFSSEEGEELETLQGGDHDPRVNGFTLRALDLSLAGAFDPYFDAVATVGFHLDSEGETVVELEEAFLQTQSLPYGLQLRAGQFFTEFGLHNPSHPHDWAWLDQPVMNTRVFGPDGARAPGVRLAWAPVEGLRLLAGAQNATGETMASFLANEEFYDERPIGGRAFLARDVDSGGELAYHARLETAASLSEATVLGFGLSAMFGPNASGPDGETRIFGADATLAHGPFTLRAEAIHRRYEADADPANGFPADDLSDYGGYVQALYAWNAAWAGGLRYEYAAGSGASLGPFASRDEDPFRDDRRRISPLLVWSFAPSASLTLQYNYDRADHLEEDDVHAVWLGLGWALAAGDAGHGHAH